MEKKKKTEAMNKLVKEILKNGDVKTVFNVERKLKVIARTRECVNRGNKVKVIKYLEQEEKKYI